VHRTVRIQSVELPGTGPLIVCHRTAVEAAIRITAAFIHSDVGSGPKLAQEAERALRVLECEAALNSMDGSAGSARPHGGGDRAHMPPADRSIVVQKEDVARQHVHPPQASPDLRPHRSFTVIRHRVRDLLSDHSGSSGVSCSFDPQVNVESMQGRLGCVSRARTAEWVFGSGGGIAGTIYGSIVVMAVIAAGSQSDPSRLALFVAATVLLLWVAHFYAHALSKSLEMERRLSWGELGELGRREASIPSQPSRPSVQ
jgi:hypothetical protein